MKKFRLYYDKDAEEAWLKEMSLKGWAFKKFFLGVYTFEKCEPGEYNYQIDLLDNWDGNKKDFASFMEDSGVEVISQWYRWVYLRKKSSDGPFEMYTDIESKIAQYHRIKKFFQIGLFLEIAAFILEINSAIQTGYNIFWFFTALIGLIGLVFFKVIWKSKLKIEELEYEKVSIK